MPYKLMPEGQKSQWIQQSSYYLVEPSGAIAVFNPGDALDNSDLLRRAANEILDRHSLNKDPELELVQDAHGLRADFHIDKRVNNNEPIEFEL